MLPLMHVALTAVATFIAEVAVTAVSTFCRPSSYFVFVFIPLVDILAPLAVAALLACSFAPAGVVVVVSAMMMVTSLAEASGYVR